LINTTKCKLSIVIHVAIFVNFIMIIVIGLIIILSFMIISIDD